MKMLYVVWIYSGLLFVGGLIVYYLAKHSKQ